MPLCDMIMDYLVEMKYLKMSDYYKAVDCGFCYFVCLFSLFVVVVLFCDCLYATKIHSTYFWNAKKS